MNKFGAKKIRTSDGVFHSKKEYDRWRELKLYELAGAITRLQRQVEYEIIPAHYETVNGKRKCIERKASYIADFVYLLDGKLVVEDTKGFKTPEYILKRKLMLEKYGIRIKES